MEWSGVRKRVREAWPRLKRRMQACGPKSEVHRGYTDKEVFEAALNMVWHNHSMRNRLDERYPSPNPLYLRIAAMVRSRALDKIWKAYLKDASRKELKAWQEAFERIQTNRRAPKTESPGKKRPEVRKTKPERTGLSTGLAWVEIMRRGVEDRGKRKRGYQ